MAEVRVTLREAQDLPAEGHWLTGGEAGLVVRVEVPCECGGTGKVAANARGDLDKPCPRGGYVCDGWRTQGEDDARVG